VGRVCRVALAIVAIVSRHGRPGHAPSVVRLLAAVHMLLSHRRERNLRVGVAQGRRRRSISWTLQSSGINVRWPDLRHRWRWPIVPPWFVTLALQTGGRLVTRQLAGRNCVGQRVGAAVSAIVRRGNWPKSHRSSRVAHVRCLRVRDEGWHSLHACHRAASAVGASLPVAGGRADSRCNRGCVIVRIRVTMVRMG